jgi:hypothetical protein
MRVFHVKVFEERIEGTTAVYSSPEFDDLLASASTVIIVAWVTNVSGTSPTLTVAIEQSPDRVHWIPAEASQINAESIPPTPNPFGGDPATPGTGFARLKITLGGTTPAADLAIWVTGHDDNPFG